MSTKKTTNKIAEKSAATKPAFDFAALAKTSAKIPSKTRGSWRLPFPREYNGLKLGDVAGCIGIVRPSLIANQIDAIEATIASGQIQGRKSDDALYLNVRNIVGRLALCGFCKIGETTKQLETRIFGGLPCGHAWSGSNLARYVHTQSRLTTINDRPDLEEITGLPVGKELYQMIIDNLPEAEKTPYRKLIKRFAPKSGNVAIFVPNSEQIAGTEKQGRLSCND